MTPDHEHIAAALHADRHLDVCLFTYAEHGRVPDLADSIDLCRRLHAALVDEAVRLGRLDLLTVPTPPPPAPLAASKKATR